MKIWALLALFFVASASCMEKKPLVDVESVPLTETQAQRENRSQGDGSCLKCHPGYSQNCCGIVSLTMGALSFITLAGLYITLPENHTSETISAVSSLVSIVGITTTVVGFLKLCCR